MLSRLRENSTYKLAQQHMPQKIWRQRQNSPGRHASSTGNKHGKTWQMKKVVNGSIACLEKFGSTEGLFHVS